MGFLDKILRFFGKRGRTDVAAKQMDAATQAALEPPCPPFFGDQDRMMHAEALFGAQEPRLKMRSIAAMPTNLERWFERVLEVPASVPKHVYMIDGSGRMEYIGVPTSTLTFESLFVERAPDGRYIDTSDRQVLVFVPLTVGTLPAYQWLVLQPETEIVGDTYYILLKVTTLSTQNFPAYDTHCGYIVLQSAYAWDDTRKLAQMRLGGMISDINGFPLPARNLKALDIPSVADKIAEAERLIAERRFAEACEMLYRLYQYVAPYRMRDRKDIVTAEQYDKICLMQAQALRRRGLDDLSEFFFLRAGIDPQYGIMPMLNQHQADSLWQGIEYFCGIAQRDVKNLYVIKRHEFAHPVSLPPTTDLLAMAYECRSLCALMRISDRMLLSVYIFIDSDDNACVLCPIFFTDDPKSYRSAFVCSRRQWASRDEFMAIRDEASQLAIDGKPLTDEQMSVLGSVTDAHLAYLRGLRAMQQKVWGDAVHYMRRAWSLFDQAKRNGSLDAFDESIMTTAARRMVVLCNVYGLEMLSLVWISRTPYSTVIEDALERLRLQVVTHDPDVHKVLIERRDQLQPLADQGDEQAKEALISVNHKLYMVLMIKHRTAEAKQMLYKMTFDKDPRVRDFANNELRNFIAYSA